MNPYIFAYIAFAGITALIVGIILISVKAKKTNKNREIFCHSVVGNMIPAMEDSLIEVMRTAMDEIPDRLKEVRKEIEGGDNKWIH